MSEIYYIKATKIEEGKVTEFKYEEYDPKNPPMMMCGHSGQAVWHAPKEFDNKKLMCCVICDGLPSKVARMDSLDLKGRTAKCYCGNKVDSAPTLAFFKHKPGTEHDEYYCGCNGWD